ncbi:MAG TPA: antiviral reverse transcriptase Drt2 [Candidatus Nanoarchaeia archaeon]|nr:antiviral reverse transcriptase Drt2 [Candidatus Nanoarchaeia archaeon]
MDPIILLQLKDSWLKKRSELSKRRPPRRYLHFDRPISSLTTPVFKKITNPNFIEHHSFYPLISVPKNVRLYRKDAKTGLKRIEWKRRPISYSSHFDSLIYSWYSHLIEHEYENRLKHFGLDESVIAYRRLGKSNVDFAAEVFKFVSEQPNCATLALDIKGFYDTLDFTHLKKAWKSNFNFKNLPADHYKVFKSVTNFSYVRFREIGKLLKLNSNYKHSTFFFDVDLLGALREGNKIKTNLVRGIPQGIPISCVLSNLYMLEFDIVLNEKIKAIGGLYRRYSDDILIVCPMERLDEVKDFVEAEIPKLKLEIQNSKTEIRFFNKMNGQTILNEKGQRSKLQYLGIEFDGKKTLIRHKSYARFESRMKKAIIRKKFVTEKFKVPFFKRQIYESFSPLGKRNYISYAIGAAEKLKTMSSDGILEQVNAGRILNKINKKIKKHLKK